MPRIRLASDKQAILLLIPKPLQKGRLGTWNMGLKREPMRLKTKKDAHRTYGLDNGLVVLEDEMDMGGVKVAFLKGRLPVALGFRSIGHSECSRRWNVACESRGMSDRIVLYMLMVEIVLLTSRVSCTVISLGHFGSRQ